MTTRKPSAKSKDEVDTITICVLQCACGCGEFAVSIDGTRITNAKSGTWRVRLEQMIPVADLPFKIAREKRKGGKK